MPSSTVSLFLTGEDKGASAALESVGGKVGGLASTLGAMAAGGAVLAIGAMAAVGASAFTMSQDLSTAANLFQATTGANSEAVADFKEQALDLFTANFGGNLEDAAAAMTTVASVLGGTGDALETTTAQAITLRDVFGQEIEKSAQAANTAVLNFGGTAGEVFDLVTATIQATGDPADDLLDVINEYSADFAAAGFSAVDMFSILTAGSEAGAFNMDKVADSVREFTTRIIDGSDLTSTALDAIGVDSEALFAGFQDGSITAKDALDLVVKSLEDTGDPLAQDAAGVALFGATWEDLGSQAIFALDEMEQGLGDVEGATLDAAATVDQGIGPAWEGAKRQVMAALLPLGDFLAGVVSTATPKLVELSTWLSDKIPVATAALVDFWENRLSPALVAAGDWIQANVIPALLQLSDWMTTTGIPAAQQFASQVLEQLIPGMVQLGEWIQNAAAVALPLLGDAFTFVSENMNIILPIVGAVGAAIVLLNAPIIAIGALWVTVATAWANNWFNIQGITNTALGAIQEVINTALTTIRAFWQEHGDSIMIIVDAAMAAIDSTITTIMAAVGAVVSTTLGIIQGLWEEHGAAIENAAQVAWDNIGLIVDTAITVIGDVIDAVAAAIQGDWEAFGEGLRSAWDAAWETIRTVQDTAAAAILGILDSLITSITNKFNNTDWAALGQNIIDGLIGALNSGSDAVVGAIIDIASNSLDAIRGFFGIESPSKVMAEVGHNIVDGLVNSLHAGHDAAADTMSGLAEAAMGGFDDTIEPVTIPGAVPGAFTDLATPGAFTNLATPGAFANLATPGGAAGPGGQQITIENVNINDRGAMRLFIDYLSGQQAAARFEVF